MRYVNFRDGRAVEAVTGDNWEGRSRNLTSQCQSEFYKAVMIWVERSEDGKRRREYGPLQYARRHGS